MAPRGQPQARLGLRIHVQRRERDDPPAADVTLGITNGKGPVLLSGIIVRETRRAGILALDLPSLEDWAGKFKSLVPAQVERISSPEFYDFLRVHITRKYLALK